MHCLPADISSVSCEKGEVEASVFDRYRTPTYIQAGYKPYIIAAMIFAAKFDNPAALFQDLIQRDLKRVYTISWNQKTIYKNNHNKHFRRLMNQLDERISELSEKYLPLAVEKLKELIRIPAD